MTNQNAKNLQEKDAVRIDVEPIEFDGLLKSKITTSLELADMVNALFVNTLADYEGCTINPIMGGNGSVNFSCSVYFRDKGQTGDGRIKCLENVLEPARKTSSVIEKIERYNKVQNRKVYTLTDDCKDALSEFIVTMNKDNKINWNSISCELTENRIIYMKLDGIDLYKILRKVYGFSSQKSDYTIIPLKPLAPNNFLINIVQLDVKSMEILAQNIGIVPNGAQLPIVRARM